ncbi:MAG: di-trans,poly-cis-decaprenylcistransferase [Anaerolineales bacterium]|nr:di-trans,poly-cis-decaprenylcistransferase [Anaerolineales bacterium]
MATDPKPLPLERIPQHVGIIMDGNGRWAISRGLPRLAGHRAGVENLRRIISACVEFGVKHLTIYAFSTENWGRPPEEVKGLLFILDEVLDRELAELHKEGVQLRHIGWLEGLAPSTQKKVLQAVELTRHNTRLVLNVAFNYGGRAEIIHAIRQMLADGVTPDQVTEDVVNRYLYTAGQPDPDLIIRTAGELRVSNFLLWQAAYAEYYAADVFWPDFDKAQFRRALEQFAGRERRFGLTSAQIASS